MLTTMIIVFLIGYLLIALEHPLKINKAGTALLTGTIVDKQQLRRKNPIT